MRPKNKAIRIISGVSILLVGFVIFVFQHVTGKIELGDGLLSRTLEVLVIRPKDKLLYSEPADRFLAFSDTSNRNITPCAAQGSDRAVFLIIGQSNAANFSSSLRNGLHGLQNFNAFDGNCYKAADPLLGNTGEGGTIWTELGNKLISSGHYDRIILAPVAVAGSSINRWSDPRDLGARLQLAVQSLKTAKLEPTHILFIQGEADHKAAASWARLRPSDFVRTNDDGPDYSMRTGVYIARFISMLDGLRKAGVQAPLFLAQKTRCGDPRDRIEGPVSRAQRSLIVDHKDIYPGPNINEFEDGSYDSDLCHLSKVGIDNAVKGWIKMLGKYD
jgi:hypothetical protein